MYNLVHKSTLDTYEFQQPEHDNLRELIRILETYCGDIELVSYGIAPNPNGFCYESHKEIPNQAETRINKLLESLTTIQENELKYLYLT